MTPTMISFIRRCHETKTEPMTLEQVFDAIKNGGHGLKEKITQIRNNFEYERDVAGHGTEAAKKAIAALKAELPGVLFSGTFSERNNAALVEYSGHLCADLDNLGPKLSETRETLKDVPYVHAIMVSPSGDGLKVVFNVVPDPAQHVNSFRAIKKLLSQIDLEIDEKCKDLARICFFTYDPDLWVRTEDNMPIDPLPPEPKRAYVPPNGEVSLDERARAAINLGVEIYEWSPEKGGFFCRCPGEGLHTNATGRTHTIFYPGGIPGEIQAPTLFCQHESCTAAVRMVNDKLRSDIGKVQAATTPKSTHEPKVEIEKPKIRFYTIGELQAYEPPKGMILVGDRHIVKGATVVLGGPPGVGKSRALVSLGYCAATEADWFGMPVHRKFKLMIIQNENGMYRLHEESLFFDKKIAKDHVLICDPPECGLCFKRADFREIMKNEIAKVMPDAVGLDPFNAVAQEQDSREYLQSLDLLRSVLPGGDDRPALIIAAHTRKPKTDERANGRALLNLLAGSYTLGSVPRAVFVLQPASDDVEDDRVVMTCCKNNDGKLGSRTAWHRKDGSFVHEPDFSWVEFDAPDKDKRVLINEEMVKESIGKGWNDLAEVRDKLKELSGASKSACYNALSLKGRFSKKLFRNDIEGKVCWNPSGK